MLKKLTFEQIIAILNSSPEQNIFDWKRDMCFGKNENEKSEIIKDITAIANSLIDKAGYIFYGVNPLNKSNQVIGVSRYHDDASFQQLIDGKVERKPTFLYYEVLHHDRTIGVMHIQPGVKPHIVIRDYGRLRKGQVLIRRGSSTDSVRFEDLWDIFYGPKSPYLQYVLKQYGLHIAELNTRLAWSQELRRQEKDLIRQMESTVGFPPGTLG